MKKTALIILVLLFSAGAKSQSVYTTHGGELIFSFADYRVSGDQVNTPMRFSCFLHTVSLLHKDFGKHAGVFTGLALRNVGFTSNGGGDTSYKHRNYYVGIPLALKFGDMENDRYVYVGVEGELGLNYKEKMLIDGDVQSRFNEWFSDRTPLFMPSVFAGFNLSKTGLNLKFKYYLQDFLNPEFSKQGIKPYAGTESSRVFYFGLSYNVRKYKKMKLKKDPPVPISL